MSELTLNANSLWIRPELKPWFYSTIGMFILWTVCLVAAQLDPRTLYEISVWTKPAKFSLSLGVYFATMIWFAHYVDGAYFQSKRGIALVWLPIACAWLEMAYIGYQASLGQPSHFNTSTPFHGMMYALMGIGAVVLVSVLVWYAIVIARVHSMSDPVVLALILGLVLTFVLGGGFGGYLSSAGGHWVNAPATDAGGTLFFGWTRQGGDLRVAHFFGMHAMQALPMFACLLHNWTNWSKHTQTACVVAFACGYSAFTTMTFMQAVASQSFLT